MSRFMVNPFKPQSSSGSDWLFVGRSSTFPDLGFDDGHLLQSRVCNGTTYPGCKVFHVPGSDRSQWREVPLSEEEKDELSEIKQDLGNQVLVFQYKGKFHAINHQCPHSSFPLSNSTPFDIEDFGIVLSAGLTCPKHGWSFDLFSGMGDRGNYMLGLWEVQLREIEDKGTSGSSSSTTENALGANALRELDKEVWVRRKRRLG